MLWMQEAIYQGGEIDFGFQASHAWPAITNLPHSDGKKKPARGGLQKLSVGFLRSHHDVNIVGHFTCGGIKNNLVQILRTVTDFEQNMHRECRSFTVVGARARP